MQQTRNLGHVLLADDDRVVRDLLAHHLSRSFSVRAVADGEEALQELEERVPTVVLVDHRMPGCSGAAVLERAKARHPRAVRMLMTASEDVDDLVSAVNRGEIHRFFRKPLRAAEIVSAVVEAAARAREEELLRVELDSLARLRDTGSRTVVRALVCAPLSEGIERVDAALRKCAHEVTPCELSRAADVIMSGAWDLVVLPSGDPRSEAIARLARATDTTLSIVLVDDAPSLAGALLAHEVRADYLTAPFADEPTLIERLSRDLSARFTERDLRRITADLIVANRELAVQRQRMQEEQVQVLNAMVRALEAKDAYTAGHTDRVAAISVRIGYELGLDPDALERIRVGALLHDIGKIGVRDNVLLKPARLTPEEFEYIKRHTTLGDELLSGIEQFRCVLPVIRHHHEKLDGSGYPDGLAGEQIPVEVRVVSVADVLDALTSTRPYRDATSAEVAFEIMKGMEGHHLDPEIVAVARRIHDAGRLDDLLQFNVASEGADEEAPADASADSDPSRRESEAAE